MVGVLSSRHILVTGGAQGIGEAIVRDCLAKGATVSFLDFNESGGKRLAHELAHQGFDIHFEACDVTDSTALQQSMSRLEEKVGGFYGLVNNAGRNSSADAVEMTEDEWDQFFDLDLKASWLTAKYALPSMRKAGTGSIVNIASIHAHMSYPNYFPYAAAKSGLLGLTRNLALDEGKHGIRVNTVSPGYTLTPLLQEWFDSVPGSMERALAVHPLGHFGEPQDVATMVSFLLSGEAKNISGADFRVDGALSARFAG
jgi:NAD(P)-dependent dehydrogenase (short-subunit alcohol dehydrogenase family)